MLNQIKEFLNSTSWMMNLLFLFLAVASIVLTIYTYLKSKKRKIGLFRKNSFQLLTESITSIKGLEINLNGESLKNLTLSYIAIWNNGNDIIEYNDFASTDRLKIKVNNNRLIHLFEIEKIIEKNNNFSLHKSELHNEIRIDFDYFARNEGIIVKVYHNGKGNSDVSVNGTIKGFGSLQDIKNKEKEPMYLFWDFSIGWLKEYYYKNGKPFLLLILLFVLGLITTPIALTVAVFGGIKSYLNSAPKEFKLE